MKKRSFLNHLVAIVLSSTFATSLSAADNCYSPCQNYCDWSFCDGKVIIGADWLFWKAEQDGLSVGSTKEAIPNFSSDTRNTFASVVDPKFQYENGYRVGLGYELPCDFWDVGIIYSYLPTHARTSTFVSKDSTTSHFELNTAAFPVLEWFDNGDQDFTNLELASKWDATLNDVDVDLGRTVCFGECLKIRPHIGFRAAWMHQKLYVSMPVKLNLEESAENFAIMKESFTGYGVEGGLWGEWEVGCGFSIVGHVGGSILYSQFNVHQKAVLALSELVETTTVTTITETKSCETIHTATPTMDYFVGLQYDDCFCDMLFSLVAGWEQHVLFDGNRLSANRGNLSTQGLTLGLEVGF